jgi:hypothetical protein
VIGSVFAWVLGLGALFLSLYTSSARGTNATPGVSVLFGTIFGLAVGRSRDRLGLGWPADRQRGLVDTAQLRNTGRGDRDLPHHDRGYGEPTAPPGLIARSATAARPGCQPPLPGQFGRHVGS